MPVDTPLRVLVMDPSPSSRSHVAVGMRQLGVDVDGVGTLEQASDVLSMRHYDLVIVDPQQPDGCGLEMMRRFKRATGSNVPVVVLSARSGIPDLLRSAMMGCSGYLVKPLSMSALHGTVRRILLRTAGRRQRGAIGPMALADDDRVPAAGQPGLIWRMLDGLRHQCLSGLGFLGGRLGLMWSGSRGASRGAERVSLRGGGDGARVDSMRLSPNAVPVWRLGSSHCDVDMGLAMAIATGAQAPSGLPAASGMRAGQRQKTASTGRPHVESRVAEPALND